MGGLLTLACRTLEAYTVAGAWDRGWSHTDRRSFGPGARTEPHASRRGSARHSPMAQRTAGGGRREAFLHRGRAPPTAGEGRAAAGKECSAEKAGRRPKVGTRPAAWSVRAAKKNA